MSDFLKRFGDDLKKNIPGFIAATVTEVKSGIAYISLSVLKDYDPELASTFYLEIVRAKMNSISALGLKDQKIKTIVVNLTSQIHFVDLSDNGEYFIYMVIQENKNINLGVTQMLLNKYKQEMKLIQKELKSNEKKSSFMNFFK